jgi:DegV family protein with EDD domain
MSRVHVVTDSTADIPGSLIRELDISVVPCQVYVGRAAFWDGVDISPEMFYRIMGRSDELPRTSQPPVSRFIEVYSHVFESGPGDGIVSIHVAGNLSGTVNAAWAAAQMLPDPSIVEIVDSGQLSMGMGWAVVEAARSAQNGASRSEVAEFVRSILPRLRTIAMIDTMDNLYRGGRISQISAVLGTALQIKPLLDVRGGEITVWGKVRTRSRALSRLASGVREWGPLERIAVMHTGAEAEEMARSLADSLADLSPEGRPMVGAAGSALATHLGLGAIGVCALVAAG